MHWEVTTDGWSCWCDCHWIWPLFWILFLGEGKRKTQNETGRQTAWQATREEEKKGGKGSRERWKLLTHRKAIRRSLIPWLLSTVITISHCWREIWLISRSALEQGCSFSLSNFPQCSITLQRGQRGEKNSKTWKADEGNFTLQSCSIQERK